MISYDIVIFLSQNSASVRLRFQAWDDDDGWSSADRIDDLFFTFSGIYADTWKSVNINGQRGHPRTSLSFRYQLVCDEGWYAYDCLCQPPIEGYSSCKADGTITCSSPFIVIPSGDSMTCVRCDPPANGMCSSTAPASDGYIVCNPNWRGPPACIDRKSTIYSTLSACASNVCLL